MTVPTRSRASRPNLLDRDGRYAFKIRRDGRFATKALAGHSNLGPVTASITGRFVGLHATGKLTYSGISYLGLVCSGGTARFRLGHNNGDAPYVPPGQHY